MGRKAKLQVLASTSDPNDLANWYVPDIEDNREDPEPFRVRIRPLTGAGLRRIEQVTKPRKSKGKGQDVLGEIADRHWQVQVRAVRECVLAVQEYHGLDANGETTTPQNGDELVDMILTSHASELAIVADIYQAITDASHLEEGLLPLS